MTQFKHRQRHVYRTEHVNGIDDNGSYIDRAMTSVQPANAPYISRELMNTYTPLNEYPATPVRMRVIIENTDTVGYTVPCKPYTLKRSSWFHKAGEQRNTRRKESTPNRLSVYVLAFFDEDAVSQALDKLARKGLTPSWTAQITVVNRYRRYSFPYYHLYDSYANPFYPVMGGKRGARRF